MTYGLLVQISVHGTDNRSMLETVSAHRDRLRAVAVTALGLSDRDYRALREAGVVGLRITPPMAAAVSTLPMSSVMAISAPRWAGICS